MELTRFLDHYTITFIFHISDTMKFGEFLNKHIPDSNLSIGLPNYNENSTLIIIPNCKYSITDLFDLNFIRKINYDVFTSRLVIN